MSKAKRKPAPAPRTKGTGRSSHPAPDLQQQHSARVAAYQHLHADAVRLLSGWAAPDERQEALRRDYLGHLALYADGVAKAGPPAHLTASVLVLDDSLEHVLLTHHRKAGAWLQLGGHLEPGDAGLYAAAQREVREESGLDGLDAVRIVPVVAQLDRHVLVGAFGACREHLDVRFAGLARDGAAPVVSRESIDVRWWPITALPQPSAHEVRGLVAACLQVVR